MAELDFDQGGYNYVDGSPINRIDLFGMIDEDTKEEPLPGERLHEVVVTAKRPSMTSAYSMMQLASMSYARNMSIYGEASPYRKHFQDGSNFAVGAVAAAVALPALAYAGAASALSSQGAALVSRQALMGAARSMVRNGASALTKLKPYINLSGKNYIDAGVDFTTQLIFNGGDIRGVNFASTGGAFVVGGKAGFIGSSIVGNLTEISINDQGLRNDIYGSAGLAVELIFGAANSKVGGLFKHAREAVGQSGRSMVEVMASGYAELSKIVETTSKPQRPINEN